MHEELHMLTKETIESLSEDEAEKILKKNWIDPVMNGFEGLYSGVIENLTDKIENLKNKYSETFADIEESINETNDELIGFIDQLTGSDADMMGLQEFKKLLGGE